MVGVLGMETCQGSGMVGVCEYECTLCVAAWIKGYQASSIFFFIPWRRRGLLLLVLARSRSLAQTQQPR
jgi:hypothetical protein